MSGEHIADEVGHRARATAREIKAYLRDLLPSVVPTTGEIAYYVHRHAEQENKRLTAELAAAREDVERVDWFENTWGVLAGCCTNVGHGDEWYWRFDCPEMDKPGVHGKTLRQAIDAARTGEK